MLPSDCVSPVSIAARSDLWFAEFCSITLKSKAAFAASFRGTWSMQYSGLFLETVV